MEDGADDPVSITDNKPIFARSKADVPDGALRLYIVAIFISLTLAILPTLGAIVDGNFKWMIYATIISLDWCVHFRTASTVVYFWCVVVWDFLGLRLD